MPRAGLSRRYWLLWAMIAAAVPGCGTVMFPERRGQPAGRLDWKIVALDGIGLLFFFVPGVVAFAVDFMTGAIYLPPDDCTRRGSAKHERRLVSRTVARGELSVAKLEQVVSDHLQRQFELSPGTYETCELEGLDDFWVKRAEYAARLKA